MTSGVKSKSPTMLASRLRWIREDAGLTQARLGTELRTGANRICHYEIGVREPQLPILRRYAALRQGQPLRTTGRHQMNADRIHPSK